MSRPRPRLATRLMTAQMLVVATGALTPVIAAGFLAPDLFHEHLVQAGVENHDVHLHAEEAFRTALNLAVGLGVVLSLMIAGLISWFLMHRISAPIESLASSAEDVAAGRYDVALERGDFSRELQLLTDSFTSMASRLQQTDASRTRMLGDLAHELRTPLATLQAYIDGLEDGVLSPDTDSWATMRSQVDRLRRLANDIREVAAAEEHALGLELHPLDVVASARAAVTAALPRFAAKQVTLDFVAPEQAITVCGDEQRLQQVFANLLDNALRHTPALGTVGVRVTTGESTVSVSVHDSGEGIPCDQLEDVFTRFHRVDPARASVDGSGSGLGLTIARAIVLDHGGGISATSDGLGAGATFTVRLPRRSSLA